MSTPPSMPTRRLRACVEVWPDCWTGGYHDLCCRFPKSCSATVCDEDQVGDDDLEPAWEPQPAGPRTEEPHHRQARLRTDDEAKALERLGAS